MKKTIVYLLSVLMVLTLATVNISAESTGDWIAFGDGTVSSGKGGSFIIKGSKGAFNKKNVGDLVRC